MGKLCWLGGAIACLILSVAHRAVALPPPEDIPEEVLRTEIILEARSPLDGSMLTAAAYDQLQEERQRNQATQLSPQMRELIFLLQLRRAVQPFIPFLP